MVREQQQHDMEYVYPLWMLYCLMVESENWFLGLLGILVVSVGVGVVVVVCMLCLLSVGCKTSVHAYCTYMYRCGLFIFVLRSLGVRSGEVWGTLKALFFPKGQ